MRWCKSLNCSVFSVPMTAQGYAWFSSTFSIKTDALKRQWDLFWAESKELRDWVHGYPLYCYIKSEKKKQRRKNPYQNLWHKTFFRRISLQLHLVTGVCLVIWDFPSFIHFSPRAMKDVREGAPPLSLTSFMSLCMWGQLALWLTVHRVVALIPGSDMPSR